VSDELTKRDKENISETLIQDGEAAKSLIKLLTDKAEVKVYKYKPMIEAARAQIDSLKKALESGESNEEVSAMIKQAEEQLQKAENEVLHGYLTPLTYRQIQLVKAGISEAQLEARKMGFDLDVQLLMSIREQRALTVYFALKRLDGKTLFFSDLKDIAVLPEQAIDELYELYMTHIGLTPDDRKNS